MCNLFFRAIVPGCAIPDAAKSLFLCHLLGRICLEHAAPSVDHIITSFIIFFFFSGKLKKQRRAEPEPSGKLKMVE